MINKNDICISIVGGSSALGKITSSILKEHGYKVVCSFNREDSMQDASTWYHCNVSSEESVGGFVAEVSSFATKHVVVYLAGISYNSMVHKFSENKWQEIIDINLTGAFRIARAYLPFMRENQWGRFVFAGSITPRIGVAGTSAYSASKAGVNGLSRTIAAENARKGITSNYLEIGYMDAGMTYTIPDKLRASIQNSIPSGQFCDPKSIARTIEYLIHNSDVSGSVIPITGGM